VIPVRRTSYVDPSDFIEHAGPDGVEHGGSRSCEGGDSIFQQVNGDSFDGEPGDDRLDCRSLDEPYSRFGRERVCAFFGGSERWQ